MALEQLFTDLSNRKNNSLRELGYRGLVALLRSKSEGLDVDVPVEHPLAQIFEQLLPFIHGNPDSSTPISKIDELLASSHAGSRTYKALEKLKGGAIVTAESIGTIPNHLGVVMRRLRAKGLNNIETLRGIGYRLKDDRENSSSNLTDQELGSVRE